MTAQLQAALGREMKKTEAQRGCLAPLRLRFVASPESPTLRKSGVATGTALSTSVEGSKDPRVPRHRGARSLGSGGILHNLRVYGPTGLKDRPA